MHRPSPMPLVFETMVFFMVPKSLNRFLISFFVIPTPLSFTFNWTWVLWPASFLTILLSIRMMPSLLVNFIALESKFKRTYWSLLMSVLIRAASSSNSLNEFRILICFDDAWSIWIEIISSTACLKLNSWMSIFNLFIFIWVKSRISLTKNLSSCEEELCLLQLTSALLMNYLM